MTEPMILARPAHEGVPAGVETGIRFTTGDADAAHATHAAMRASGVDADDVQARLRGHESVPETHRHHRRGRSVLRYASGGLRSGRLGVKGQPMPHVSHTPRAVAGSNRNDATS